MVMEWLLAVLALLPYSKVGNRVHIGLVIVVKELLELLNCRAFRTSLPSSTFASFLFLTVPSSNKMDLEALKFLILRLKPNALSDQSIRRPSICRAAPSLRPR